MSNEVTADSLTYEQIREERERAWDMYASCCYALGFAPLDGQRYEDPEFIRRSRHRVADAINARAKAVR